MAGEECESIGPDSAVFGQTERTQQMLLQKQGLLGKAAAAQIGVQQSPSKVDKQDEIGFDNRSADSP